MNYHYYLRDLILSLFPFRIQLTFFILITGLTLGFSQSALNGTVIDDGDNSPLVGARVLIEGTSSGALTRLGGNFTIKTPPAPPFTLVITFLGYDTLRLSVEDLGLAITARMKVGAFSLNEVQIVSSASIDRQKQAPLTVESMSITAIKETPAANFYEGLSHLKGVDLNSASFGFKVVNTRGFNSTQPVRSLQLIDGVDNQSPGLNFSLGNFLGASELDLESVDLIVGASSAFYGPNAFNGVISMKTKSPFIHQGLSAYVKVGERQWAEGAIRYAKAFQNKDGQDKFAFKLNLFYMRADDWVADNFDEAFRDTSGRRAIPFVGEDNPGRYDAVNRYGDEILKLGQGNASLGSEQILLPGLFRWNPTGYTEEDLVDYNTYNVKASVALHYKLSPKIELIGASSYSTGTTVFQGINRISLKDIQFFQHKFELKEEGRFFLRGYMTHEDAGNSYDPVFTAFKLQDAAISSVAWDNRYRTYWRNNIVSRVESLEGYPEEPQPPLFIFDFAQQAQILGANQDSLLKWHEETRAHADAFYLAPGTPEFQAAFDSITSRAVNSENGTRFISRSALYHLHGEYKFKPSFGEITVGGNARMYTPITEGTIYLDTGNVIIRNVEYGVYGGLKKPLADNKLVLTATVRMDKNQNFNFLFSPAATVVWTPNKNHVLRASASSAIRNPTLADQYLFYNVGRATLLGNISGVEDYITLESLEDYGNTNNGDTLRYFDVDPIRPEQVRTVEAGYRATLGERLYLDAGYYFSFYKDFIGYRLGFDGQIQTGIPIGVVYRVAANAQETVTTQGFSLGLNYFFQDGYTLGGNYSWNVLNTAVTDTIIPAFNTPEHKFNVSFSGRDVRWFGVDHFGFNINFKWVQGFLFEGSPQFTGHVPTYYLLDLQLNKYFPDLKTTFKLGASNVLNNKVFTVYGGPRIGRLAYFSASVDLNRK